MTKVYTVPSESIKDKFYNVVHFEDTAEWLCDCPAYKFNGACKHIKQVAKKTYHEKIIEALRMAGSAGIHSFDMRKIGGLQAPVRILELKRKGFDIVSIQGIKKGNSTGCLYILVKEKPFTAITESSIEMKIGDINYLQMGLFI